MDDLPVQFEERDIPATNPRGSAPPGFPRAALWSFIFTIATAILAVGYYFTAASGSYPLYALAAFVGFALAALVALIVYLVFERPTGGANGEAGEMAAYLGIVLNVGLVIAVFFLPIPSTAPSYLAPPPPTWAPIASNQPQYYPVAHPWMYGGWPRPVPLPPQPRLILLPPQPGRYIYIRR